MLRIRSSRVLIMMRNDNRYLVRSTQIAMAGVPDELGSEHRRRHPCATTCGWWFMYTTRSGTSCTVNVVQCFGSQSRVPSMLNCLKKNQNAPRPSEHPPVMGGKCQNV